MSEPNLDGIPDSESAPTPARQPNLSGIPDDSPSLKDRYDAASTVDPNMAAQVLIASKKTGAPPAAVAANLKDAVSAAKRPSDDFFDEVQSSYPVTAGFMSDPAKVVKATDDLGNLVASEHATQRFKYAKGYWQAIQAGLEGSVLGHIYDRGAPDLALDPNDSMGHQLTSAAVGFGMDFPFMVLGGAGAAAAAAPLGPGAAFAAGPGAFALPAFLKSSIAEYYRTGDATGIGNALEKSWSVAKSTGKQAMVGLITELTGGLVNKASVGAFLPSAEEAAGMTLKQTLAKVLAQNTAMTVSSAAMEGKAPTAGEFATNLLLTGGVEGVHYAIGAPSIFDRHQAVASQNYAQVLDEMAKQSEFRRRDPEGYSAHMNELADQPARIPVEAFEKHFPDAENVANQLGIGDSYREAKSIGGDVEMPMGTFLSKQLDKFRPDLSNDVRFDPDGKTLNQIKTADQETETAHAADEQKAFDAQKQQALDKVMEPIRGFADRLKKMLGISGEGEAVGSRPNAEPSAPESASLSQQAAPEPAAQTGTGPSEVPQSPFPDSVTGHPVYVKSLESASPVLQKFGVHENDREGIIGLYNDLHTKMHDLLDEAKSKPSAERMKEIRDEMNDVGAKEAAINRHAKIVSDPEAWLPYFEKRDGGDMSGKAPEDVLSKFLPGPEAEAAKASKQEVDSARQDLGQIPQRIENVDPETAKHYSEMEKAAMESAEKILLKPQLEEMRRDADAERKSLEAGARIEVENDPMYQAEAMLDKFIGKRAFNKLQAGDLSEQQENIFQAIAEKHGFTSADELAKKLSAAPSKEQAIKQLAEEMSPKPIRNTPEFRSEAMKALHNEKMGDVLALKAEIFDGMKQGEQQDAEYRAGVRDRARVAAAEAKGQAKSIIAGKSVKDAMNFRPYYTAERDAALRAYKAAEAGDYEAAAKATREQLQAHALAAESLRARDNAAAWMKSLGKEAKADPESFKTQEHYDQAAWLMHRFGIDGSRFGQLQLGGVPAPDPKSESLSDWMQRMNDKTGVVAIPPWLMDESVSKPWRQLSMQRLHDLSDAVKNIKSVANSENKMWTIHQGEQLEALVEEMHAAKAANVEGGKTPGAGTYKSKWDKIIDMKDAARQALVSPETLLLKLDGYDRKGIFTTSLIETKANAEDARASKMGEVAQTWRDLHSDYSQKEMADLKSKPIWISEFGDSFTRDNLITLAANQGNDQNQAKVRQFLGIKDGVRSEVQQQVVDSVLSRELSQRDWKLAGKRIEFASMYRDEIGSLYKKLTGFEPEWVDGQPIKTPFGQIRGGYYPLVPDPRVTVRGFEEMANDDSLNNPPPIWKASTRNGFTEARNQYAKYAVSLDGDGLVRHMSDVVHDLTMREWVLDANRIFGSKSVQSDLVDAFGMNQFQSLKQWVRQIAGNDVKPLRGAIDDISADLRRRSTVADLGGKIAVMLSQAHGVTAAGAVDPDFGVKDVAYGILSAYGNMLKDPSSFGEMSNFVEEKSAYMKQRERNADRDLADANREVFGENNKLLEFANHGFGMIDSLISKPIWMQAYRRGLELEDGDHEAAVTYADRIIRNSTVSGRRSDLPEMMRSSETSALVTMFHGFVDRQFQLMYRAADQVDSVRDVPKMLGTMMAVTVIPNMIYALTHDVFAAGKDQRKKWEKAAIKSVSPFSMIPVANTLQDMAIDHYLGKRTSTTMTPVGGIVDAYDALLSKATSKKSKREQQLEAAAHLSSYAVPYPDQINRWLFNTVDYVFNGMKPQVGDILQRRPAKQRRR